MMILEISFLCTPGTFQKMSRSQGEERMKIYSLVVKGL